MKQPSFQYTRSKLAAKSPSTFASFDGIAVDFFNPLDDVLDPFSPLHAKEAAVVGGRREVSRAALWLNIRQVFSLPRRMAGTDKVTQLQKLPQNETICFLDHLSKKKLTLP